MMEKLKEEILKVLKKHAGEENIHTLQLKYGNKFEQMITEIASLHPLTKLTGEVERLRDEAQVEKYKSETTLAKVLRDGKISAFNQVLSLLPQENESPIKFQSISKEEIMKERNSAYEFLKPQKEETPLELDESLTENAKKVNKEWVYKAGKETSKFIKENSSPLSKGKENE